MSFARFLNGALRYKNEIKPKMMKELAEVNKNPKVSFIFTGPPVMVIFWGRSGTVAVENDEKSELS